MCTLVRALTLNSARRSIISDSKERGVNGEEKYQCNIIAYNLGKF